MNCLHDAVTMFADMLNVLRGIETSNVIKLKSVLFVPTTFEKSLR
jgi:hypothetical protein